MEARLIAGGNFSYNTPEHLIRTLEDAARRDGRSMQPGKKAGYEIGKVTTEEEAIAAEQLNNEIDGSPALKEGEVGVPAFDARQSAQATPNGKEARVTTERSSATAETQHVSTEAGSIAASPSSLDSHKQASVKNASVIDLTLDDDVEMLGPGGLSTQTALDRTSRNEGASTMKASLTRGDAVNTHLTHLHHNQPIPDFAEGSSERPPYTWTQLIAMAMCASGQPMNKIDVYDWVSAKYPFCRGSNTTSWLNSIGQNMSLFGKPFKRVGSVVTSTGNMTTYIIRPGFEDFALKGAPRPGPAAKTIDVEPSQLQELEAPTTPPQNDIGRPPVTESKQDMNWSNDVAPADKQMLAKLDFLVGAYDRWEREKELDEIEDVSASWQAEHLWTHASGFGFD